jgi:hypothetical protein
MEARSTLGDALFAAIKNKESDIAKSVLDLIKDTSPDILKSRDLKGRSFLQLAIEAELISVIDLLFELQKTDMGILFGSHHLHHSVLFETIKMGMLALTRQLLEIAKKQPAGQPGHHIWHQPDNHGYTLLHAICYYKESIEMSQCLLEIASDDPDLTKLINQPVSSHTSVITGGSTALHIECSNGRMEFAELLIRHGASLTIIDDNGKTALETIPETEIESFLMYLAERGAFIGQKLPYEIGRQLVSLVEKNGHNLVLVGATVEYPVQKAQNKPARHTKRASLENIVDESSITLPDACVIPESAAKYISADNVDLVLTYCTQRLAMLSGSSRESTTYNDVLKFYETLLSKHKTLRELILGKFEYDRKMPVTNIYFTYQDAAESDGSHKNQKENVIPDQILDMMPRYKQRLTSALMALDDSSTEDPILGNHSAPESTQVIERDLIHAAQQTTLALLNADKAYLNALIYQLQECNHHLAARPYSSRNDRIRLIVEALAPAVIYAALETLYRVLIRDLITFGKTGYDLTLTMEIVAGGASFGATLMLFVHRALEYWNNPQVIDKSEWNDLLEEIRLNVLDTLQQFEQQAVNANNNDVALASSLPATSNAIRLLEQHIDHLTNNLSLPSAITAIKQLTDDLIQLRSTLNRTQTPIGFWQRKKNADISIQILDDENENEFEGREEEMRLLSHRNRS